MKNSFESQPKLKLKVFLFLFGERSGEISKGKLQR